MISLPNLTNKMTETMYNSFIFSDEDCEHDDNMTAEDYDQKQYERDGWNESQYDRQYW